MTDWPLDSQQTMTNPPTHPTTQRRRTEMDKEKTLQIQVHEEMRKFEKTMEELTLLRNVSQDLKNYRKMIKLKKYD
jgi:hypothetical protein